MRPESVARIAAQRQEVRLFEIELFQIGSNDHVLAKRLAAEDLIPLRTIGGDLHRAARTDREHNLLTDMRLDLRNSASSTTTFGIPRLRASNCTCDSELPSPRVRMPAIGGSSGVVDGNR